MKSNKKKAFLAASVAGLMAVVGLSVAQTAHAATGELEHCYGINSCKGSGSCAGKSGCAGKNSCKGHGFVDVAKGSCLKIENGSLKAS